MASASSPLLFLLFLVLAFLPLSTIALTSGNITLGASLSTDVNSSWVSPSGDFAFGFNATGEKDQFLLAVWYDKIPEKTVIWSLTEQGQPVVVQKGSKLQLTTDGLYLTDRQNQGAWAAQSSSGTVASAAMLDTGNFVLLSSDSVITWQSFDIPTDTILPTQNVDMDKRLISYATETNFSNGRFELHLQTGGNLVLYTVAPISRNTYDAYWESGTDGDKTQLVYNETGMLYLKLNNGSVFNITKQDTTSYPAKDFYQRVRLDFDGVLRQYVRPKPGQGTRSGNQSWKPIDHVPDNICLRITGEENGSGACGYNSYCVWDENWTTSCKCPTSWYSYIDQNNKFAGCAPNFTMQSCLMDGGLGEEKPQYDMVDMPNTNWPFFDYEHDNKMSEYDCQQSCLDDCLCAVAIFSGSDCWKKKLPLSNGVWDTSVAGKAFIKVPRSNSYSLVPPQPQGLGRQNKDQRTLVLIMSVLFGSSAFLSLLLLSVILFAIYFSNDKKAVKLEPYSSMAGVNLRSFTYKELEEITDGFKEELGSGSCGTVYKGVLPSDAVNLVAVKKIDRVATEAEKEFRNEVSAIARIHHKNLVQLLGFCDEGPQRLLVYEFMSNGSLGSFLFSESRPQWYQRTQIAFGIARGLTYLHEDCNNQIIHCDIKPQNILLDDSFRARISDFGLAKLLKTDQTRTTTGIRGTRGYVAPEWFKNMAITAKVDVYSFGVMLLEIICCRRNVDLEMGDGEEAILTDWAYDCYRVGQITRLVEGDREALNDARKLERMVMVAIWCIQEDPSLRPTMKKVSQMLEGAVDVAVPPDPFSFISSLA